MKSNKPKNWLDSISEGSWEPELLISGLAIFSILQLPELLWKGYQYYQYNLQAGTGWFDADLPLLIYSVFTAALYFLLAAFIIQFMCRAFWVGFLGLMSVYGDGIKYENLPYGDYYKERAREKLGSSYHMAEKLDDLASRVFSIAFALVLLFIAIGFIYMVFFLFYNCLKLFLSPQFFQSYSSVLFASFLIILVLFSTSVLILNMQRFRENPRFSKWYFNLSWKGSALMMPFVYKPIQFITLTFRSNISTRKFITYNGLLIGTFFAIMIGVLISTEDNSLIDTRDYYMAEAAINSFDIENYSSLIDDGEIIDNAVIKQPVVRYGLLSVFIPYPKLLDTKLKLFCDINQPTDSLSEGGKEKISSRQYLDCAEQFFTIRIDSSKYRHLEFLFTKHSKTEQVGFKTFLDISMLSLGHHTLYVKQQKMTKTDSTSLKDNKFLSAENVIPFWVGRK